MLRRRLLAALALATALAAGAAGAESERPPVDFPGGGGQFCLNVFLDEVDQTVCIPTPS